MTKTPPSWLLGIFLSKIALQTHVICFEYIQLRYAVLVANNYVVLDFDVL
jgi:hypothetical protein